MKKWIALFLLVTLLPCAAIAETVTANGTVEAVNTVQLVAPYSGTLLPFDYDRGDAVKAGDTLFAMDTVKVYAPADGAVTAIFAQPGDSAEDVQRRYGMLACVERTLPQQINASVKNAYNDKDNKLVHVGETMYYECSKDNDDKGTARVTAVNGDAYTL